jgi:RimJ/RimL family protein N-acetyltransferase
MHEWNALGQPVGLPVPDWTPPPRPAREIMRGRWGTLEPLSAEHHGAELWDAARLDAEGRSWTWMSVGPFSDEAAFRAQLEVQEVGRDPLFFAVRSHATGRAEGFMSLMRIAPEAGAIEIGFIWLGPRLQRSRAATEAIFLLMGRIFALGYRRFEWKCDSLNEASRAAALRYGFSYEGVFRQAMVVKGRNRDTAWYACIDAEWPRLKAAYETWLAPENFDAEGRQRVALSELTRPVLAARG